MAQVIKQAPLLSRIGSGLAQGIGLQAPQEIERYRMQQGLQQLENQDLTPLQYQTRAASIPGMTPQLLQSMTELLKMQNQANATRRSAGMQPGQLPPQAGGPQASPNMAPQAGGANIFTVPIPQGGGPSPMPQGAPVANQPAQRGQPSPQGQMRPQVQESNPLAEHFMPRGPWSPQQVQAMKAHYQDLGFLPDEAAKLTAEAEQRYQKEAATNEERYQFLKGRQGEARDALSRNINMKLQKEGGNVFADIPGTVRNRLERGMERDLRSNPNITLEDAAETWGEKGYRYTRAKNEVNKLAQTTGLENWIKGPETFNKLKSNGKIFAELGNQEEYSSMLQDAFDLSPQGADSVAFEKSKGVQEYLSKFKPVNFMGKRENLDAQARKVAIELEGRLSDDDSLLGIAYELSKKQPQFDQVAFFDQLTADMEDQNFTDRQKGEIAKGSAGIIPRSWGDIFIIPHSAR